MHILFESLHWPVIFTARTVPGANSFVTHIPPARTFTFADQCQTC